MRLIEPPERFGTLKLMMKLMKENGAQKEKEMSNGKC